MINKTKHFLKKESMRLLVPLCILCLWLTIAMGCSEDIDESNLYTFTNVTIEEYIQKHKGTFGLFDSIVKKGGYFGLLSAYGKYTCFLPTNNAVTEYLKEKYNDSDAKVLHNGMTAPSVEGMPDSLAQDFVQNHLIVSKYLTTEMEDGAILNMKGRYLTTNFSVDSTTQSTQIYINASSKITEKDVEVENGVIQVINKAISPSNAQLPDLIASKTNLKIFSEALQMTGLADSLKMLKKDCGTLTATYNGNYVPTKCSVAYTAFVETDDVLNAAGIHSVEDLIAYANEQYKNAADWYNGVGTVSTGNDYTDRNNALNMFMAYHLIKYRIYFSNLVWSFNELSGRPLYEYYETMLPNTLFKVTRASGNYFINRYETNSCLNTTHDLVDAGILISNVPSTVTNSALNGVFHYINEPLVYNSTVPDKVLNERIRMDVCSMLPEMMNNGYRGLSASGVSALGGGHSTILFPIGYFDNLKVNNGESTHITYVPRDLYYSDYQGDEFLCTGAYDFSLRLPAVPPGTYEIRLGYAPNNWRGMLQFYLDNNPTGIPLDMRKWGTDASIGWTDPSLEDDGGVATDKAMRNRGYMRAPYYFYNSFTPSGCRFYQGALRRIIVTAVLDQTPHWIRFKTVIPDQTGTQFELDYFELVPSSVYKNPNYSEDIF